MTTGRTSSAAELNRGRQEADDKKFADALRELTRTGDAIQQWRETHTDGFAARTKLDKLGLIQDLFSILQIQGDEKDPIRLAQEIVGEIKEDLIRYQKMTGTAEDWSKTPTDSCQTPHNEKLLASLGKLFPEVRKQVKITDEMRALFRSIGGQLAYYERHFAPFRQFRELLVTDHINKEARHDGQQLVKWLHDQLLVWSNRTGSFDPTQQQALIRLAMALDNMTLKSMKAVSLEDEYRLSVLHSVDTFSHDNYKSAGLIGRLKFIQEWLASFISGDVPKETLFYRGIKEFHDTLHIATQHLETVTESSVHVGKMMDKAVALFDDPLFLDEPLDKRIKAIDGWFTEFVANRVHDTPLRHSLKVVQAAIDDLWCVNVRQAQRLALFDNALDTSKLSSNGLTKVLIILGALWNVYKQVTPVVVDDVPQKKERPEPQPLARLDVGGGAYRITNEWLEWVFYTYNNTSLTGDEATVEETKNLITKLIHDHVGEQFAQPNIQYQLPRGTSVSVIFPSEGGGLVFITQDVSAVLGKPEKE